MKKDKETPTENLNIAPEVTPVYSLQELLAIPSSQKLLATSLIFEVTCNNCGAKHHVTANVSALVCHCSQMLKIFIPKEEI